jgi:preprotein translocase subunit SecD
MPGVQDPERVKSILQGESRLELVYVVGPPSPAPPTTYMTEADALASLGGTVPPNRRILPYIERIDARNKDANEPKPKQWVVVESPAVVDGSELRTASAVQSHGGSVHDYEINFSLKKTGAEKFGNWTSAHVNDYMGVVLNNEVKSIAFIKSPIYDSGQITGRFTQQSAEDLALTLRSAPCPLLLNTSKSGPSGRASARTQFVPV